MLIGFILTFIPKIQIEEGSNFLLFQDGKNLALKSIVPDSIYQNMKAEFRNNYETSEKICLGDKINPSGCWRDYFMSSRSYAFSMDSVYQNTKFSRIVSQIDYNNVKNLRSGFLNDVLVDFNTNWYEWKSEGDPIREKAPYFIHWKIPSDLGGKICIIGKFFVMHDNELHKFYPYSNNSRCIDLSEKTQTNIIAYRINKSESLKAKYISSDIYKLLDYVKKIISILYFIFN